MTIVLGTDLSAPADGALRVAALLAARLGQPLRVVHVLDDLGAEMSYREPLHDPLRERLAALAQRARALGADAEPQLLPGSAPRVLALVATEVAAPLLVIAAGGRPTGAGGVLGSVAEKIVRASSVPVLAVRDPGNLQAWLEGERALRVLAGAAPTGSARTALRQLSFLRRLGPADVAVVHVAVARREHERLGLEPATGGALHPAAMGRVRSEIAELVGPLPGEGALEIVVRDGSRSVADHLDGMVRETAVDLVVVGAERRQGADRLLRPSVSREILRRVTTNVLVAPAAPPSEEDRPVAPVRSVLVASDFSDASIYAVRHAVAVLPAGGELHLAHVLSGRASLLGDRERAGTDAEETADEEVRESLARSVPREASDRGIQAYVHVLDGAVAEAICGAAERLGVDVVCVGSRRPGGVTAAVLGSVTQKLLAHSHKPVLVVKPPAA